jgi:hypothetical protein
VRAPETFETKKDAEIWLSQVEADLSRGDWRAPDAGAVNFREYAEKWVEEVAEDREAQAPIIRTGAEPRHV